MNVIILIVFVPHVVMTAGVPTAAVSRPLPELIGTDPGLDIPFEVTSKLYAEWKPRSYC